MTKIISIANFKGGVGKTTSTINIGAGLARKGFKTLLIDLDAQYNLTQSLGIGDGITVYDVLSKNAKIDPVKVNDNLFVLPSSLELIKAEIELAAQFKREYILDKALKTVKNNFDYIFIDCPPSLGLLTINAFFASDFIFVPVESEYLSLNGFAILSEALKNIDLEIDKVFITKYDNRKILNRSVKDTIINKLGSKAFKTVIRSNIALAEAPTAQTDIFNYNGTCNGAKDYQQLINEIIKEYE